MTILNIISMLGYVWLICDLIFVTPYVSRLKCTFQTLKSKYDIADEDAPDFRLIRFKKRGDKKCKK